LVLPLLAEGGIMLSNVSKGVAYINKLILGVGGGGGGGKMSDCSDTIFDFKV
jgi:hypothetical protein